MKEIYRSFEGKLNVENQRGYVIYEADDYYEIESLSVWTEEKDQRIRIKKKYLSEADFSNRDKITELWGDIENGRADFGQCFYKNKWYEYDAISKIQEKNKDMNWKKYV